MASMLGKIHLLQQALRQEDYIIEIYTSQFFNQDKGSFVKVYHIRHNKEELYRSSLSHRCVLFLADLYKIVKEIPTNTKNRDIKIKEKLLNEQKKKKA